MRQPFKTHHIMNIESKEFWEKVKEEYSPTIWIYEICGTSGTFKNKWFYEYSLIKIIARRFLKDCKITGVYIGESWLFHAGFKSIEIRKQFIDYCIQKYSK